MYWKKVRICFYDCMNQIANCMNCMNQNAKKPEKIPKLLKITEIKLENTKMAEHSELNRKVSFLQAIFGIFIWIFLGVGSGAWNNFTDCIIYVAHSLLGRFDY